MVGIGCSSLLGTRKNVSRMKRREARKGAVQGRASGWDRQAGDGMKMVSLL